MSADVTEGATGDATADLIAAALADLSESNVLLAAGAVLDDEAEPDEALEDALVELEQDDGRAGPRGYAERWTSRVLRRPASAGGAGGRLAGRLQGGSRRLSRRRRAPSGEAREQCVAGARASCRRSSSPRQHGASAPRSPDRSEHSGGSSPSVSRSCDPQSTR